MCSCLYVVSNNQAFVEQQLSFNNNSDQHTQVSNLANSLTYICSSYLLYQYFESLFSLFNFTYVHFKFVYFTLSLLLHV